MSRGGRGIASAFARARAGDRRLAAWMSRNHDALLRELGTGRVEWTLALSVFARLGLTDEGGKAEITRDTASRTWRRVREAVTAARRVEARGRPAPGELAPGVRLVLPTPAAPVIRAPVARPAPAPAPVPGSPAGAVEATERIAAVLAMMGAARVPLPSQPLHRPPPRPTRPTPRKDPAP